MDRKVWSFALLGIALRLRFEAGRIEEARVVFGGAAPIPWRSPAAERSLLGTRAEAAAGERAAHAKNG